MLLLLCVRVTVFCRHHHTDPLLGQAALSGIHIQPGKPFKSCSLTWTARCLRKCRHERRGSLRETTCQSIRRNAQEYSFSHRNNGLYTPHAPDLRIRASLWYKTYQSIPRCIQKEAAKSGFEASPLEWVAPEPRNIPSLSCGI